MYLVPFVYTNNKELIDEQLNHASHVVGEQTQQIKNVAGHHTARATESVKSYAGDYSAKAQEYMGSAKQSAANATNKTVNATSNAAGSAKQTATNASNQAANATKRNVSSGSSTYKSTDFPNAPQTGPSPLSDQFKATADELSKEAGMGNVKRDEGPILAS